MPKSLDLADADDLEETGSEPGRESKSKAEPDYKSKYSGVNSAYQKALKKIGTLEAQIEALSASHEEELATIRQKSSEAEKRAKEFEAQFGELNGKASQYEKELTTLKQAQQTRKTILEKYAPLRDAWDEGLLKDPSAFEKPEDWEAYLGKMIKAFGIEQKTETAPAEQSNAAPPPTDRYAGATPQIGTRVKPPSKQQRNPIEIAQEMMALSPDNPKYRELEQELLSVQL